MTFPRIACRRWPAQCMTSSNRHTKMQEVWFNVCLRLLLFRAIDVSSNSCLTKPQNTLGQTFLVIVSAGGETHFIFLMNKKKITMICRKFLQKQWIWWIVYSLETTCHRMTKTRLLTWYASVGSDKRSIRNRSDWNEFEKEQSFFFTNV